jgi:hypothetical protein
MAKDDPALSERLEMRATKAWIAAVDGWRRKQHDLPSRGEAIRRLVEQGLTSAPKPRRPGAHKGAQRATELAAKEIDRLADTSATEEERQSRKRRILKGPREFRDMREDLPKRKRRRSIPVSKLNASNDV